MKTLHFICPFSGLATASCHTCMCLQPEVGSRLPHVYVCVCVCCCNCGNIKHGHEQSEKRPNRADQTNSGQTELTKATQTKATVGVAELVLLLLPLLLLLLLSGGAEQLENCSSHVSCGLAGQKRKLLLANVVDKCLTCKKPGGDLYHSPTPPISPLPSPPFSPTLANCLANRSFSFSSQLFRFSSYFFRSKFVYKL